MSIDFGREICGELNVAQAREWLVTNGIGGYASGTVAGMLTRSYHGLLVAALRPPLDRTLLLAKVDDTAQYDRQFYPLFANCWKSGVVDPSGYKYIESFCLEGTIPVWHFTFEDVRLEKRIWMQPRANTTYIHYTLKQASQPLKLSLKALVNYRIHHGGDLPALKNQVLLGNGISVTFAVQNPEPFYLFTDRGSVSSANDPNYGFKLAREAYRGLKDFDNDLHVATFEATIEPGDSLTFVASTEQPNPLDPNSLNVNDAAVLKKLLNGAAALEQRRNYEKELIEHWQATRSGDAPEVPNWVKHLVLAADQFIVDRPLDDNQIGKSAIAGYHWFNDWGRDTMISLPGLTLSTGRQEIASLILRTFARYVSQGMLPNRFPDGKSKLTDEDYNTVDATLWYFEAIRIYYATTGDDQLLKDIFPKLKEIIDWHCRGTRYNIKLDPKDGLISAGADGVQLTWMDAKVNDWVVTPRRGKPVEINALWYNALRTMSKFAQKLEKPHDQYDRMVEATKKGFERFWNREKGCCFDVLDGPEGKDDAALRPNQLFAVSLPESPLNPEQQRSVVEVCGRFLLTSHGLRSLAPDEPQYQGHYGGDRTRRDSAYHQGTVWGWLIGPFVLAHLRVFNDPDRAREFLKPMAYHLRTEGLGSISEIFDGDAPYHPRGCIAQAWSVAEVLRTWLEIENKSLN